MHSLIHSFTHAPLIPMTISYWPLILHWTKTVKVWPNKNQPWWPLTTLCSAHVPPRQSDWLKVSNKVIILHLWNYEHCATKFCFKTMNYCQFCHLLSPFPVSNPTFSLPPSNPESDAVFSTPDKHWMDSGTIRISKYWGGGDERQADVLWGEDGEEMCV